jgi:hypothetical protein
MRLGLVTEKCNIHVGLDFNNQNFFLADRADTSQRFFYNNDQVSAGAQYAFGPNVLVEASGGYAFDRFYFEGKNFTGSPRSLLSPES